MSMNSDLITALSTVALPVETGVYSGTATNYIVLTPLGERNDDIADDADLTETEETDVNLYYVGNYLTVKNKIKALLKAAGFFIRTDSISDMTLAQSSIIMSSQSNKKSFIRR